MALPVHLRAVDAAADGALLLDIYASTRADELALTGWDPATQQVFVRQQFDAQTRHYGLCWPHADHWVIEVATAAGRLPAGRLWVDRGPDALRVLDIALLPDWRGQGIGSALLRDLMEDARRTDRPLTISVEHGNPARHLYDRLGFVPAGEPEGLHQRMAWRPEPSPHKETCDEQA